jgi:hypothetical protein
MTERGGRKPLPPEGRERRRKESKQQYEQSPRGKEKRKETNRRQGDTLQGRKNLSEAQERYRHTEQGQAKEKGRNMEKKTRRIFGPS